jgi:WD40 repeat protein
LLNADEHVIYCGYAEGRIEARSLSGIMLAECAHSLEPMDSTSNSVDVTALAISPDGKILLSGTAEGEVRLWNAKDLRFLGVLHARDGRGAISSIDFSANGKRLLVHQALVKDAPGCGTLLIDLP